MGEYRLAASEAGTVTRPVEANYAGIERASTLGASKPYPGVQEVSVRTPSPIRLNRQEGP